MRGPLACPLLSARSSRTERLRRSGGDVLCPCDGRVLLITFLARWRCPVAGSSRGLSCPGSGWGCRGVRGPRWRTAGRVGSSFARFGADGWWRTLG